MVSTLSHCANIPYFIALWSRQQERDSIAEYVLNVPQKVMLITHPLSSGQGLAVPFGCPSLIFQNCVMKLSILYLHVTLLLAVRVALLIMLVLNVKY